MAVRMFGLRGRLMASSRSRSLPKRTPTLGRVLWLCEWYHVGPLSPRFYTAAEGKMKTATMACGLQDVTGGECSVSHSIRNVLISPFLGACLCFSDHIQSGPLTFLAYSRRPSLSHERGAPKQLRQKSGSGAAASRTNLSCMLLLTVCIMCPLDLSWKNCIPSPQTCPTQSAPGAKRSTMTRSMARTQMARRTRRKRRKRKQNLEKQPRRKRKGKEQMYRKNLSPSALASEGLPF